MLVSESVTSLTVLIDWGAAGFVLLHLRIVDVMSEVNTPKTQKKDQSTKTPIRFIF